jgi:hypothetical protein
MHGGMKAEVPVGWLEELKQLKYRKCLAGGLRDSKCPHMSVFSTNTIFWSECNRWAVLPQNGKLLAERDGVKRRSEELATEKDTLKVLSSLVPDSWPGCQGHVGSAAGPPQA